ncbi:MAG: excinuclease ABC subunit UvrC [Oscillospiraceae bacterium]|nr:excinuclease ABC subunit UvrC [Oscillospiraceae bacterium]
MFDFEEEIKNLPEQPGVYLMHNKEDEVIYVGKAKILKNRVRQYFRKNSNHTPKVLAMVAQVAYFEYIITDSEREALALENNLIKKYKPKYNILLKDDKQYPYIKVSINEPYPRVFMVHRMAKDGAKYYGPYMGKGTIKNTLEIIQKLFKPPTCSRRFPQDIRKGRPCLNYHIDNCIAPCTGKIPKEEYRKTFFEICRFLEGKHERLIEELTRDMSDAAAAMQYEKAAACRDKIRSIRETADRQKIVNTQKHNDIDVIAAASEGELAFIEVFFIREGKVIGREYYRIENIKGSDKSEMITDFVKQFYSSCDFIPTELITEAPLEDSETIADWLRELKGRKVIITSPKRGEKLQLVSMVRMNAEKALSNHKLKVLKEKEKSGVLKSLQELLSLPKPPNRIEAYDISNIQGSDNVAAMAVFEYGRPAKRKYRKFKIKTVDGADDYASMKEVIFRRFRHGLEEEMQVQSGELNIRDAKFLPYPDLILLDGGKGHLNAITEVMEMIDNDTPMFGMVKNDRHRTRGLIGHDGEIEISLQSPVFKLITHIQDEVHDAAISYFRKLHDNITSELDKIPGIGEKRRTALLTKYGNIDKIKNAEVADLADTESMDIKSAEAVYNYFRKKG